MRPDESEFRKTGEAREPAAVKTLERLCRPVIPKKLVAGRVITNSAYSTPTNDRSLIQAVSELAKLTLPEHLLQNVVEFGSYIFVSQREERWDKRPQL